MQRNRIAILAVLLVNGELMRPPVGFATSMVLLGAIATADFAKFATLPSLPIYLACLEADGSARLSSLVSHFK